MESVDTFCQAVGILIFIAWYIGEIIYSRRIK